MERHLSGWMNRGMDRQTGDWSTGEWVGRETDKWVNRQREGWTDRQACCAVPTAQPGFRALASPIAASCLRPVSPTFLPPREADHPQPWPFPPAQGVPSPPGDPADPSPSPGSSGRVPRLPAPWAPPLPQQLWGPAGAGGWHEPARGPSAADGGSGTSPWREMTARRATCSPGNCLFLAARVFLELFLPLLSRLGGGGWWVLVGASGFGAGMSSGAGGSLCSSEHVPQAGPGTRY